MKNSYKLFTVFVFILLISVTGVFATTQEDLINEARNGVSSWESGVSYTKDMVVSFDGILYKTLKDLISDNVNNPVTATNLYTPIKNKELVKLTTYKETKFKDKTLYTGDVAVKGLNLTGTEIFVSDRQLVGLADYNPENFTVSLFTGNDGVKYSIYSYHNETDPNNLNTDRSFIRENGDYLFDVYSDNGFVKYDTAGFSTQIASIPNMNLGYLDSQSYTISDYFSSYTEDEVFVDLNDATYISGDCVTLINLVCKMTKDGTPIVTDEYTATHETIVTTDFITFDSNSLPLTTLVSIAVNDGVDFLSDSFTLTIAPPVDPAVTTNTASSITDTTATLNGAITETGGATVSYGFDYRLVGAGTWTNVPKGSTAGTVSYTHGLTGLTASTNYEYRAYVDDGTPYYGSTVSFTTSASGGGGGSVPDPANTVSYWKLEDLTDATPNGNDLTNVGATSGVTGVIDNAYSFLSGDYMTDAGSTTTYSFIKNTNIFTISFWAKTDDYTADSITALVTSGSTSSSLQSFDITYENRVSQSSPQRLQMRTTGSGGFGIQILKDNAITDNNWHNYVFTSGGSSATSKLYIDGVDSTATITYTGTKTGDNAHDLTIGGLASSPSTWNWVGDIDEIGIFDANLNGDQITYLYNSGTPTSEQQYPFTPAGTPPTQDASINNFALEVPAVASIDLDDYFTNFTSFTVTYDDPDSAGQIVLTGTSSDTSSTFTGETNGLTNVLTLTSIAEMTALNIEISVCNVSGCISQTPTLTITEPLVPPVQISSLVGFAVVVPDSQVRDIDDWFTGFTGFTVQFTNPDDSQPVSLSGTATHTNSKFTIATNGLTNEITVTGIADITALPFTVQVTNTDGAIQDSSTITVSTTPLVPPVQISSLVGFTVTVPDSQVRDIDDWFTGFTGFTLQFTNPDDSQPVSLSGTGTHTNSKFTIETNGLTNEITVTGIAEITALPFTIQVTNTDGTIQDNSTITVSLAVVEPTDVDVFLDGFGNTGSPIVRLIVGLMIVLALVVAGWYYTQTVFIGVFAGIIGLIITVAVGLISIWLVLLIILLALIPLIYIWVFGRGG